MRNLSNATLAAIYAQETSAVWLYLLTLTHPSLGAPIRLCSNVTDITSRGNVYTAYPFQIAIPSEIDGELPRVELLIDNVARLLVDELRTLATPLTATLELILASAPDTVEAGPWNCTLKKAEYDALTVRLDLGYEDILNEPVSYRRFTPTDFPGLFNAVDR